MTNSDYAKLKPDDRVVIKRSGHTATVKARFEGVVYVKPDNGARVSHVWPSEIERANGEAGKGDGGRW